tara:strand:- start:2 stop:367 length:366 start_codon:yes stop_codon:yes gene_type:complete
MIWFKTTDGDTPIFDSGYEAYTAAARAADAQHAPVEVFDVYNETTPVRTIQPGEFQEHAVALLAVYLRDIANLHAIAARTGSRRAPLLAQEISLQAKALREEMAGWGTVLWMTKPRPWGTL